MVAVAALRSLFVYATPVTPFAVVPVVAGGTGGLVSVPSTAVLPAAGAPAGSSMLCRRFWPVSLTTRSRLAAGLKSTPNELP